MNSRRVTRGSEQTMALGRKLGSQLQPRDVVLLSGPLGAGKSTLAAGLGHGLGVSRWKGSPTFTLINEYGTEPRLVHVDLYRLGPGDMDGLGLEEYVEAGSILVVEWPERAIGFLEQLPANRLWRVEMSIIGEEERALSLTRVIDPAREASTG